MVEEDAGAKDLRRLNDRLRGIAGSKEPIEVRLDKIAKAYEKTLKPWVPSGDDGVMSRMRNLAASVVETTVKKELNVLRSNVKSIEKLDALEGIVQRMHWVPEGFKSSIKVDIAFVKTELRLKIRGIQ